MSMAGTRFAKPSHKNVSLSPCGCVSLSKASAAIGIFQRDPRSPQISFPHVNQDVTAGSDQTAARTLVLLGFMLCFAPREQRESQGDLFVINVLSPGSDLVSTHDEEPLFISHMS